MYADRKKFYEKIEKERNSKVIAYVTGDRPGLETRIGADTPDVFLEHLDKIGKVNKISLILYTCGGDTLAARLQLLKQASHILLLAEVRLPCR